MGLSCIKVVVFVVKNVNLDKNTFNPYSITDWPLESL